MIDAVRVCMCMSVFCMRDGCMCCVELLAIAFSCTSILNMCVNFKYKLNVYIYMYMYDNTSERVHSIHRLMRSHEIIIVRKCYTCTVLVLSKLEK